ncbi:MAG: TetR/AcrR family transcriptional regulator [Candidatus Thiodiazotropha lotti]|nr:TetR/AcrR family transcriptional regulator [Candidatus Thiodiazotropha lotti]
MKTERKQSVRKPTRQGIIDAARNHIYHKGFGATSYANIAQETNLRKGNIQYHFKSKDELLQAVIDQQITAIRQQLESWSLECGTTYDCVERFIAMVDANADNLSRYGCPMGTLNSELSKDHREQQLQAKLMFDLYLRWLEARFSAILPRKSARARAEQLMVMAQGASLMAHVLEDPEIVHRQSAMMLEWLADICAASH